MNAELAKRLPAVEATLDQQRAELGRNAKETGMALAEHVELIRTVRETIRRLMAEDDEGDATSRVGIALREDGAWGRLLGLDGAVGCAVSCVVDGTRRHDGPCGRCRSCRNLRRSARIAVSRSWSRRSPSSPSRSSSRTGITEEAEAEGRAKGRADELAQSSRAVALTIRSLRDRSVLTREEVRNQLEDLMAAGAITRDFGQ